MTTSDENYRIWATNTNLWDKLKPLAREHRHQPTPAEDRLWQALRGQNLDGLKFRRQHTFERFIVDFFCAKARLVIEVDGSIYQYTVEEDKVRQAFLESQNLRVIRFSNEAVMTHLDVVLDRISIVAKTPHPQLLSEFGEGSPENAQDSQLT